MPLKTAMVLNMRPVKRGDAPKHTNGALLVFKKYGDAFNYLIDRIGSYCSYCEIPMEIGLAVEHIQPKYLNPAIETEWSNFLLCCPSCNSRKGKKYINSDNIHNYYWPHLDNTFRAFIYASNQAPKPAESLNDLDRKIAQGTLELTGLNQEPITRGPIKDKRWKSRNTAWSLSEQYKQELRNRSTDNEYRNLLINLAISRGFWSVWMTVFQDDVDMRKRLIEAFKGTDVDCFDAETLPRQRVGGKI